MEKRNVELTLDKAKEWYKQGDELKEVALQAFSKSELMDSYKLEDILTFKDACKVLSLDYYVKSEEINILKDVNPIYYYLEKLRIIVEACNYVEGYKGNWATNAVIVYYPRIYFSKTKKCIANFNCKCRINLEKTILYCVAYSHSAYPAGGPGRFDAFFGLGYTGDYLNRLYTACATEKIAIHIANKFTELLLKSTFGEKVEILPL